MRNENELATDASCLLIYGKYYVLICKQLGFQEAPCHLYLFCIKDNYWLGLETDELREIKIGVHILAVTGLPSKDWDGIMNLWH